MIQIPDDKLKEILIKDGVVSAQDFAAAVRDAQRMGQSVSGLLISRNFIKPGYYNALLAKFFGVEAANLSGQAIDEAALRLLTEDLARQKGVVIFKKNADGSLGVAMADPTDLATVEFLTSRLGFRVNPYLASDEDLKKGFALYGKKSSEDFQKIIAENVQETLRAEITGKVDKEAAQEVPVVAIVDNLVSYAISSRASDIHIEILEDSVLVRYRIDGILHEISKIPKEVHNSIVARLKLLAGLRLDEHSKPQDGRFRFQTSSDAIDIRVSAIPTFYGEKIEMRLLSSTSRALSFEELGMLPDTVKIVQENISKTYGIVLVTGPTGSGKSTTLYSMLSVLNKPEVNISTIEDPVEYDMKYVNQTQVNEAAGITFANGLRALLRQDPNVIMVGEVRDGETAEISVQAALTGHLVLSTLHTNDAPSAIPRLIDLKVEPFLAAAVLNVVLAQRLVRQICPDCVQSYPVTPEVVKIIQGQMKGLGIEDEYKPPRTFFKGKGCVTCGNTGYKGRIAIFEAFNVDEKLREIIVAPNFTLDSLKKELRKKGFITMFEDGLRKVAKGMTTIEEVLRVIRE